MNILESDAPLIVYIDVKSPYAFVAIEPILQMEQELDLHFDWRPMTLDIPSFVGVARKSKGKLVKNNRSAKNWRAVKYAYADARRYAERQGLILKGTEKIWDSSIANIAILWTMEMARHRMPEYLHIVYPRFWTRNLNIEDISVVQDCLQEAGIPDEGFAAYVHGEGRALHDKIQPQFHDAGMFGVPSFVFGDEILFGREHLPYVRWHLEGRRGGAPDIGYIL